MQKGCCNIVNVDLAKASVQIINRETGGPPFSFTYDATFGPSATQRGIYDQEVAMVVADVLNGKPQVW